MSDPLTDSHIAESAHAAAVAKEAEEKVNDIRQDKLVEALRHALTYEGNDRPALVARIPVICNDIRWIKKAVFAILGGIGGLAIMYLTHPH